MPDDVANNHPPTDAERLTAFHEAGHAVMAELCGRLLTEVEIVGDREHSGMVHSLAFPARATDGEDTDEIERHLKIMLAGIVAEAMVSGRRDWDESGEDLESAVRLAMRLRSLDRRRNPGH
jgi:ATP-dependent Zn protease